MAHAIKLGDRLLKHGIVTPEACKEAVERQRKFGGRFGTQLLDMGVISRFTLTNLLNRQNGFPLLLVADDIHVKTNAAVLIPRQTAQRYSIVPISKTPGYVVIGAMDPPSAQVIKEIEAMLRIPVHVTMLPESLFHQIRRDNLQIPTDFFANHVDPAKIKERPFQEGHQQIEPRDLIVFEVAGITMAFVRRNKNSKAQRLGDMLIEDGIVTQQELDTALARHAGMHIGEALLEERLVDSRLLSRYLSRHYQCATIDPYAPLKVESSILKLIHPGTARKFMMLPLAIYEGNLLVLTPEPENQAALQIAQTESKHSVRPVVTPLGCARWLIDNYYPMPVKPPAKV